MLYAFDENKNKIEPTKSVIGFCPTCGSEMIPKMGNYITHHWAHKSSCSDNWHYEPMSEWHRDWQNKFPKEWQEVTVTKNGKTHRADVMLPNGVVIEFQNSKISRRDIEAREAFWDKLIWVFNAKTLVKVSNLECLIVADMENTGDFLEGGFIGYEIILKGVSKRRSNKAFKGLKDFYHQGCVSYRFWHKESSRYYSIKTISDWRSFSKNQTINLHLNTFNRDNNGHYFIDFMIYMFCKVLDISFDNYTLNEIVNKIPIREPTGFFSISNINGHLTSSINNASGNVFIDASETDGRIYFKSEIPRKKVMFYKDEFLTKYRDSFLIQSNLT